MCTRTQQFWTPALRVLLWCAGQTDGEEDKTRMSELRLHPLPGRSNQNRKGLGKAGAAGAQWRLHP